jgi:hypothetical protein
MPEGALVPGDWCIPIWWLRPNSATTYSYRALERDCLIQFCLPAGRDEDVGSFLYKTIGRRQPYPAIASGDDSYLAFLCAPISRLP